EAFLQMRGRDRPAVAGLMTAAAATAVGAQALEERTRQVHLPRGAESRGEARGIREAQHIRQRRIAGETRNADERQGGEQHPDRTNAKAMIHGDLPGSGGAQAPIRTCRSARPVLWPGRCNDRESNRRAGLALRLTSPRYRVRGRTAKPRAALLRWHGLPGMQASLHAAVRQSLLPAR